MCERRTYTHIYIPTHTHTYTHTHTHTHTMPAHVHTHAHTDIRNIVETHYCVGCSESLVRSCNSKADSPVGEGSSLHSFRPRWPSLTGSAYQLTKANVADVS